MVKKTLFQGGHPQSNADTGKVAEPTLTPYDLFAQGHFGSYADYTRVNTTSKIKSSNNSTFSSMLASRTLFKPYQMKPLLKFLNAPNRRLLVADEVGLGKTIEAGNIMNELKARGELGNVLLVVPKSLKAKWKNEMREKFGIEFTIYNSNKDLLEDLRYKDGRVHAIINYEKMRLRPEYNSVREEQNNTPVNIVDYITQNKTTFGLIVCDEAHRLRNKDTQTYRGAEIVMNQADAVLFLTATPIMIRTQNLFNLLHLLDNVKYDNPQIFENFLRQARPFVFAIGEVAKNKPFADIKEHLTAATVEVSYSTKDGEDFYYKQEALTDIFEGDPIFEEIMVLLDGAESPEARARLQDLLNSVCNMNNIFSRTRKREVTMDMSQAERKPHFVQIHPTQEEADLAEYLIRFYVATHCAPNKEHLAWILPLQEVRRLLAPIAQLGCMQVERQLASSTYAYCNTEANLDDEVDEYYDKQDIKVERLIQIFEGHTKNCGGPRKMVVFAIFRKTLKYIQLRLKRHGYSSRIIHGGVDQRTQIITEFRDNPDIQFLLSSEVGGEGLDMEFCSAMVNYDLPWNPMVVEQRIGRLDRFGQKSPVVHIYNMVVEGSIQEYIYSRLLYRIGLFRDSIGDLEAILDAPFNTSEYGVVSFAVAIENYEKDFYTGKLTHEEVIRKLDEIALAVENEQVNVQKLDEGLNECVTKDAYIVEQINRLRRNNAFVTDTELRRLMEGVLSRELPGYTIKDVGKGVCEFTIPAATPDGLQKFLQKYQPIGGEAAGLFADFVDKIYLKPTFRFTFSQNAAYFDRSLIYVNMYHPLIRSCLEYYERKGENLGNTFSYTITADADTPPAGPYYLAVFELVTQRTVHGVIKTSTENYPILFDVNQRQVVKGRTAAEHVYGISQVAGEEFYPDDELYGEDLLHDVRNNLEGEVAIECATRTVNLVRTAESERLRNEAMVKVYYQSMIRNKEKSVQLWEEMLKDDICLKDKERRNLSGAIRLTKATVVEYKQKLAEKLKNISTDRSISVTPRLRTLSLVKITKPDRPDKAVF